MPTAQYHTHTERERNKYARYIAIDEHSQIHAQNQVKIIKKDKQL